MEDSSILQARWIKPPHRWSQGQTCVHAIFVISNPAAANKVLMDGLLVCQKHIYAEKCKKEPMRCLKCHGWGHLSYDCMQQYDTCGTCAGRHCTPDCKDSRWPRCVSCQTVGHPSWDRQCWFSSINVKNWMTGLQKTICRTSQQMKCGCMFLGPPMPACQNYCVPIVANGMGLGPQRSGYWQSTLNFPTAQHWPQLHKHSAATSE